MPEMIRFVSCSGVPTLIDQEGHFTHAILPEEQACGWGQNLQEATEQAFDVLAQRLEKKEKRA